MPGFPVGLDELGERALEGLVGVLEGLKTGSAARDVAMCPSALGQGQPVLRMAAAMPLIVNNSGRSASPSPARARRRRSICM